MRLGVGGVDGMSSAIGMRWGVDLRILAAKRWRRCLSDRAIGWTVGAS